jgi:hypothetical protein
MAWSKEEDELLIKAAFEYSHFCIKERYIKIKQYFPTKTVKQLKLRWKVIEKCEYQ